MTDAAAPQATREAVAVHLTGGGILNPGLLFDRFLPRADQIGDDPEAKQRALEGILNAVNERTHRGLLAAWNARWDKTAEAAGGEIFERACAAPLIVGLGRKGMFEIGFSFHRSGFPYIPGSALKGLARTWAFFQVLEQAGNFDLESLSEQEVPKRLEELEKQLTEPDEKTFVRILQADWLASAHQAAIWFRQVFGHKKFAGHAIFMEAIPRADGRNRPGMVLDILNPHYPEYTAGKSLPTNWQDPQPTKFLTVRRGVVFRFAVGWRGEPGDKAHAQAEAWLQDALARLGVGAKTSAGYGYFAESAPKAADPVQPVSGPFVDEVVTGRVYAQEGNGYWVWLDGISTEENDFLAWLPAVNIPELKEDDAVTAVIQPYRKLDRTVLQWIE